MNTKIIAPALIASLSLFTACGGGSGSSTAPKAVFDGITEGYKVVKGKPTLDLDGTNSTDNGIIKSYKWTIDDSVVSNSAKEAVDISSLNAGQHKVCLVLVDDDDKTTTKCKTINIIESTLGVPTAVINGGNLAKVGCASLTLDASESKAANGEAVQGYQWFLDGEKKANATTAKAQFEFGTTGDHEVKIEVTDSEYNTATKTKTINVTEIGKPTIKLTILNPLQQVVFSGQTNTDKTWDTTSDTDLIPSEGNHVFISVDGSYDDCNATDDNITYSWDARIHKDGTTVRDHCFIQKPGLAKVHRDFNTTGFDYASFATVLESDSTDYSSFDPVPPTPVSKEVFETTKYIHPAPDGITQKKYIYIELCNGEFLDYNRLEITLTARDNLHNKEVSITKTIGIKAADTNSPN
jgi:hypothetical protein